MKLVIFSLLILISGVAHAGGNQLLAFGGGCSAAPLAIQSVQSIGVQAVPVQQFQVAAAPVLFQRTTPVVVQSVVPQIAVQAFATPVVASQVIVQQRQPLVRQRRSLLGGRIITRIVQ